MARHTKDTAADLGAGNRSGGALPEKYAASETDTRLNVKRFEQVRDEGIPSRW